MTDEGMTAQRDLLAAFIQYLSLKKLSEATILSCLGGTSDPMKGFQRTFKGLCARRSWTPSMPPGEVTGGTT
jgi:hypothetical protein